MRFLHACLFPAVQYLVLFYLLLQFQSWTARNGIVYRDTRKKSQTTPEERAVFVAKLEPHKESKHPEQPLPNSRARQLLSAADAEWYIGS
jgi:hypothetical protein